MSALAYISITLAWFGLLAGAGYRAHTRRTSLSVRDIERILLWRCGYMLTTDLTSDDQELASRLHAKRLQLKTRRIFHRRRPADVGGPVIRSQFGASLSTGDRLGDGDPSRVASRFEP
jgi:hypothetical protein